MRRIAIPCLLTLLFLFTPARALQGDAAGKVTRVQGAAMAVQDAMPRVLSVGSEILIGDVLSTGKGSRLEITMSDESVMTLGERASFVVNNYIYLEGDGAAEFRIIDGAFKAVSGQIAALKHDAMTVTTETATIGIRGTEIWGGALADGPPEVALLSGREVSVTTRGGTVILNKAGEGTKVGDASSAPTAPKVWGEKKIIRAKATVAFD